MNFDLASLQVNARGITPRIGGAALPYLTECVYCMAHVHTIYQEPIPQERILVFSMISGRASSDGDSRRWVTRTLSE
jgi:hypothetical protein